MKIALFALGFLAFARGLEFDEGSGPMRVEFDSRIVGCGGITPIVEQRNYCRGFAEIRSEFNGVVDIHGRIEHKEDDYSPKRVIKMRYRVPGRREAQKIIQVQGNCCWTFYQR